MSLGMNALLEKYGKQISTMEKVIKDKCGKTNFTISRDKKTSNCCYA